MTQKILNFSEGDSYLVLKELHDIKDFLRLQGKSLLTKGLNAWREELDDEFYVYLFLKAYLEHLKSADRETWKKVLAERKERILDEIAEEEYE